MNQFKKTELGKDKQVFREQICRIVVWLQITTNKRIDQFVADGTEDNLDNDQSEIAIAHISNENEGLGKNDCGTQQKVVVNGEANLKNSITKISANVSFCNINGLDEFGGNGCGLLAACGREYYSGSEMDTDMKQKIEKDLTQKYPITNDDSIVSTTPPEMRRVPWHAGRETLTNNRTMSFPRESNRNASIQSNIIRGITGTNNRRDSERTSQMVEPNLFGSQTFGRMEKDIRCKSSERRNTTTTFPNEWSRVCTISSRIQHQNSQTRSQISLSPLDHICSIWSMSGYRSGTSLLPIQGNAIWMQTFPIFFTKALTILLTEIRKRTDFRIINYIDNFLPINHD
ncbi:MAG: hypothetical protein EZS28_017066 [Streblomastix strix]|uniref:Uncharacterized protein n=1 Tax=Streblomastix strix TaxID=222440 RepID=A0A5J4VXP3_9EUKA|nr:MAG: hypothetical protein EZS28_017066 [Streblomastix strix]